MKISIGQKAALILTGFLLAGNIYWLIYGGPAILERVLANTFFLSIYGLIFWASRKKER